MTRSQQIRLWRRIDRKKAAYRRQSRIIFSKALDEHIKPVFEKLNETSDIRDFEVPPVNMLSIETAYEKLYNLTALDFAFDKRRQLKKSFAKSDEEIFEDLIRQEIRWYIQNNTGSMITAVGDTSKDLLMQIVKNLTDNILAQGIGGSEGVTMLRDLLDSEWHRAKRYRIERIVRTEVNRAANFGGWKAGMMLEYELEKIWLSVFADTSRETHKEANEQTVPNYEPFVVVNPQSGQPEKLMFPGDVTLGAGAANTINCLCGMYERPIDQDIIIT